MQEVIILRGLPASGKTTWARDYCTEHTWFRRVSKDDIRAMIGADYSSANEDTVRGIRDSVIRVLIEDQYSVIVDDTNIKQVHLRTIERICVKLGVSFRVMEFDTSADECIARDATRPNPVGADVIRKMDVQWHGVQIPIEDMRKALGW